MERSILSALCGFAWAAAAAIGVAQSKGEYDVEWTSPSRDSSGSMPLGNGDVGVNLWVEEGGDLLFYLSKSDAWSENARLLKLGRVRVSLDPNPFVKGVEYAQRLRLATAEIDLRAGSGAQRTTVRAWVDANDPVVRIEVSSASPFAMKVTLEPWRTERRRLAGNELDSAFGLHGEGAPPVFVEPDVIVPPQRSSLVWYHRNERSIWGANLALQGLAEAAKELRDPLLHLTVGGTLRASGLVPESDRVLHSTRPLRRSDISLVVLAAQTPSADAWLASLERFANQIDAQDVAQRYQAHREWWQAFWERSWIRLGGFEQASAVSRGYALQRYMSACAGRGRYPIKFNGSLFTVDAREQRFDADYRRWGGPYWWQNTRLPYWAMPAAGDFDLMEPLYRMYRDALPLARLRTPIYYKHGGVFFPETMYFWGTYVDENYGREREDLPLGTAENRYIRYEWQGGIELVALMLEAASVSGDELFLKQQVVPLAREVLEFYDRHYLRDDVGRIRIHPAQALESFWDVPDPMPEVAGLRHVLATLLATPAVKPTPEEREAWAWMLETLPPLPTRGSGDTQVLAPAERTGERSNSENPELYAVFPYPLFGVERNELELALRTFAQRDPRGTGGWRQDAIWAACLGVADEAGAMVIENFTTPHAGSRFPGFYGPNDDWNPDQCHPSVAMIALQRMLLQSVGAKILLLPAWPPGWDVDFKLRAAGGTTVECSYRGGEIRSLRIDPPEREKEVKQMLPR